MGSTASSHQANPYQYESRSNLKGGMFQAKSMPNSQYASSHNSPVNSKNKVGIQIPHKQNQLISS